MKLVILTGLLLGLTAGQIISTPTPDSTEIGGCIGSVCAGCRRDTLPNPRKPGTNTTITTCWLVTPLGSCLAKQQDQGLWSGSCQ